MPINSQYIKQLALEVGFSDCGFSRASALSADEYPLEQWLDGGCHAGMQYMERNTAMRRDPRLLVEGARTVISLVAAYKPDRQMEGPFHIAMYAYGEDYHERLKRMMYQLIALIRERYPDFEGKPCVDTVPISDRHWALRAGLGWIGRNSLFIHRSLGSFCFLCEIVTTAELEDVQYESGQAESEENNTLVHGCGDCHLCIDACPNGALSDNSPFVDARKCTSYNTIENRDQMLPDNLDARGYIFGCDICQLVCPYNRQAPPAYHLDDSRKAELESLPYVDETAFRHFSKHSALSRIKYCQWQRNIKKVSDN